MWQGNHNSGLLTCSQKYNHSKIMYLHAHLPWHIRCYVLAYGAVTAEWRSKRREIEGSTRSEDG